MIELIETGMLLTQVGFRGNKIRIGVINNRQSAHHSSYHA
jgi:hypothetical protein